MPSNLVSVIVPMYNAAAYLRPTLASISAQTHRDLEILLVDDGSTDGTGALAGEICAAEPRARYLRKTNGGQGSARNLGMRQAGGDLFAFCDSDDLWRPDKLARQLPLFTDPEVTLAYCGTRRRVDGRVEDAPDKTYFEGRVFWELLAYNCVPCSGAVLRREAAERAGYFDERLELKGVEDKHLWLRVARLGSLAAVREPLVDLTIRSDSVSRDEQRMLAAELACLDDIRHRFPPADPAEGARYRAAYAAAFRHYGHNLFYLGDYAAARRTFSRLLTMEMDPKALVRWLACFLPPRVLGALRRMF